MSLTVLDVIGEGAYGIVWSVLSVKKISDLDRPSSAVHQRKGRHKAHYPVRPLHVLSAHTQATPSLSPRKHHLHPRHPPAAQLRAVQRRLSRAGAHGDRPAPRHPNARTERRPLSALYLPGNRHLRNDGLTAEDPPSTKGAPLGRRPSPRSETIKPAAQRQLRSETESKYTSSASLFIPTSSATLALRDQHDHLQTWPTTAARS